MSRFLSFFRSKLPAFAVAVIASFLVSCQPEQLNVEVVSPVEAEGDLEYVQLPVVIDCVAGDEEATKATALNAAEGRASGAMVLVYRHGATPETSLLDSYTYFTQAQIEAATASNPLKVNVPVTTCDFYILGNLNGIHRTSGAAVNLMEALGADFPVLESDLEAMLYRLDGGAINGTYRREKMSEINTYGIPYQRIEKNVNVRNVLTTGIPNADKCIRLFSKVNLTIDHEAFDGDGANPTYFTNKRLVVRQVNNRLQPFSTAPQKAAEAADVLAAAGETNTANFADYDLSMESYNASSVKVSLYVPENMQGNLLSNPASGTNNLKKIPANVAAGVRPYVTYVEYVGSIDKSAGGYGADVTYQFCLGGDAYNNFDLERGKRYDVTLGFTVNNLFAEPEWKVNLSGWTDYRLFALTADPSFSTDISSVQAERKMSVRKGRDGFAYVYMNPSGSLGQTNYLLGKDVASASGFTPSSIADCAWSGDLVTSGTADYKWLSDRGMSAVYDKTTGKLTIQVDDDAKFDTYSGNALENSREFKLKLLPNGTETSFIVRMMPDITFSVADGKSLTDEFYIGQSRSLIVSGFSGSTVRYAAVQPSCGPFSDNLNHQWKLTNSMTEAFPQGGDGNTFSYSNISTGQVVYTGSAMTLYAFYPNRFQSSHGWTSKDGKIVFVSEDWWNDSFEVDVRISEPRVVSDIRTVKTTYLPMDGTEVGDGDYFGYKTFDGSGELHSGDFDTSLYDQLLKFQVETPSTDTYMDCVGVDEEHFTLFCKKTIGTKGKLEEASEWTENGETNLRGSHSFYLRSNDATVVAGKRLFPERVYGRTIQFSRMVLYGFSTDGHSVWGTDPSSAKFTVAYFKTQNNDTNEYLNQYEYDEKFFIYAKYRGRNFNVEALEFQCNGSFTEYVCPSGDRYGPVYEVERETDDTGSGGVIRWVYDESHQVMRSAHGEFVPGGLLLPYGEQTVTVKYTNKWDNREFVADAGGLTFNYSMMFGYFVGATKKRNASLYYIPLKNIKYLLRMDNTVNKAGRSFMLKVLDGTDWYSYIKWYGLYLYKAPDPFGYAYRLDSSIPTYTLPQKNSYDVQYVNGCESYTQWSQVAINKMMAFFYPDGIYFKPGTPYVAGSGMVRPQTGLSIAKIDGSSVPAVDLNGHRWGPYISSGNGAGGDYVRGVFVDTSDDFSD